MYNDEHGNFKGEALVVYFRPESVALAIRMLDESDFRHGVPGPNGQMRVQEADSSFKKGDLGQKQEDKRNDGGEGAPKPKKSKAQLSRDQKKAIDNKQRMNE